MIADNNDADNRPETDTVGEPIGPSRREQRMSRMVVVAAALSSCGPDFGPVRGNPPTRHPWKPKGNNCRIKRK